MNTFTLEEWGIILGNSQWKLLTFKEKISGYYIISHIGNTGLHLSIHPSNQKYLAPHVHFTSDNLEIHEDVNLDYDFFSPDYWLSRVEQIIQLFEIENNAELGDNPVLFLPNLNQLIVETNNQHFFNLNSIIDGKFFVTEEKKIPLLVSKLKREVGLRVSDCSIVGITEDKQILLPFDREHIIRFEYDKLFETILRSNKSFFNSIEQTLNRVGCQLQSKIPVLTHNLVPSNIMQEFENMKRRKPKLQLIQF